MINWQDKAYRTLQEHVLRNTQDIRELFKKLRHTRWTPENVAKLYDSLTALKYDDPEIALDLIDELITALGGNPPARPKHALIGIKAETTHGAVDQYDLIDKDWFSVTAYFEDGTSEPVDEFLLLTEVALTAPYTNVEIEYLGFRDIVPLEAKARRVITLNTANTTTVVNDQTGRVLHNGDSVFDGDVLTMASSQPNGGYLITGRNVEQLGIVNPIDVGGSVTVQADVIVNVFAKAEVYHTVTINKASGVTFTLVDEDGNNVASGASLLEGTKIIVTALSDTYPHAAVVGGELIQLYVGTVIVVSDDVVITVGEAQPEPPVEYVRYLGGYPLYEGYGGTQWMDYDNIPKGKTLIVRLDEVPTGEVYEYDMFDENDNVIGGLSADKNTEWQPIVFDKTFGIRFKQPVGHDVEVIVTVIGLQTATRGIVQYEDNEGNDHMKMIDGVQGSFAATMPHCRKVKSVCAAGDYSSHIIHTALSGIMPTIVPNDYQHQQQIENWAYAIEHQSPSAVVDMDISVLLGKFEYEGMDPIESQIPPFDVTEYPADTTRIEFCLALD